MATKPTSLFICKRIMQELFGKFEAESKLNIGTEITISINPKDKAFRKFERLDEDDVGANEIGESQRGREERMTVG